MARRQPALTSRDGKKRGRRSASQAIDRLANELGRPAAWESSYRESLTAPFYDLAESGSWC
jgi:hypothetical protein